ncbi:MAG TPA: tryptophan--tRNA ligase [Nitrososphaeraceae archaeon]|nr:tryptophan--tRNA ligase [Nitrososphaeraceae archaeon]
MESNHNIEMNNINNSFDHNRYNNDIIVTPWEVLGDLEDKTYIRLIEKFGTQSISQELIEKFKKLTGEIHPLLKSQYFFSHRDMDWLLNKYENGEHFYLYTGRGPSGFIHLGHLLPWLFTKYLQDKFGAKLLFQITDDEKFLYNLGVTKETISTYTSENILDIIAIGFNPDLTRIIIDTKHIQHLYPIATEIARKITFSTAKAVFGFTNATNIGMIGFPSIQAAPCFLPSIIEKTPTPVLIPAAIDQDPYWRITRDIATKLGFYKPAQIHSKFLPSLSRDSKMSSSRPETAILTTDEPEIVEKKVLSSFTGGQATISLQKKLGGNADICPVYDYLKYFFDDEKESLERYLRCKSGNLLCGECKSDLANNTRDFIIEFQRKRDEAKNKVNDFMFE